MSSLAQDFRFAFRTLRRSPLFASVALLSLALGIGANTAIFTLLDQLVLRLLPVKDPQQLAMIWSTGPHMGSNRGSRAVSYPMYQDFQKKAEAFSYVFCRYYAALSASYEGQTERVNAELVSGNYFQALGVGPAAGRVFSPAADDRVYKGHPAVVLSYRYWVDRFGARPDVIGRKILVNNYPMEIVGVSAAGFNGLDPMQTPQIRVPIQMKPLMTPGWDDMGNRRSQWVQVFGRMKPGYNLQSARASLQPLFHQILVEELTDPDLRTAPKYYLDRFLKRTVQMEQAANGYSDLRHSYATALVVLMCMVGLVLVIACSNVANLLVARAVARQKEIAVRLSLGASRWQLLRQLLVESVSLSVAAGAIGLAFSYAVARALIGSLPGEGLTLTLRAEPDWRILGFNIALAVATGLVFGLAPAFHSTRVDLCHSLKDVATGVAGAGGPARLRRALVTAQVALSFLLLTGAGLFVKTLGNLKHMPSGFRDIGSLTTFQVEPSLNGYPLPKLKDFHARLLEDVRAMPGVRSAGWAFVPVLHGWEWDSSMSVEGHQIKDGEDMQAFMNAVSPGYFQTMGIPLLAGRDFDRRDAGEKFTVAVVNRAFAQHFFGDRNPIGRRIGFGTGPKTKLDIEIVGVVENSLYEGPREGVHRQVFVASAQTDRPASACFYVRADPGSGGMFGALRNAVRKLDPAMPVFAVKTLEGQLDETLGTERLIAALSAAFGALATLLAALGLYGVMAFTVARRTKEIGLRMALGAQRREVLWLVMREACAMLGAGLAVAVPLAFVLSRYVSSQLFGVPPADLWTGAAALALLAAVAAGAGFLPARRASTIDPIQALRYE